MALDIVFVLLSLAWLGSVSGFIYDDYPCFAPCTCPPAYYMNPTVDCANHSLTSIPSFDEAGDPFERYPSSGYFYQQKFINLNLNHIKSIPASAFGNLGKRYPRNNFTINLSDNEISHIDQNAFEGLENNTVCLNLRDNRMTSLPVAFKNIGNLESLDMTDNPLHTLNADVINHIAPNLKQFFVSIDNFSMVPKSIGNLRTRVLGIKGYSGTNLNEKILDDDYVEELQDLFISNSSITDASAIPCRFPTLDHLQLSGNYRLHSNPFSGCQPREPLILDSLKIEWCNLTSFEMSIYKNVSWMSLRGNLLDHVPDTVSKMTKITMLDLSYNRISHITNTDFQQLSKLNFLYLEYNPLTVIDVQAFSNNRLMSLLLAGTQLTTIPDAIFGHSFALSLQLPETLLCTCTSMANLKGHTLRYTYAHCANDKNTTVSNYVNNELPNCP